MRRLTSPEETFITVVDRDDRHVYQPGLLFVPFGLTEVGDIVRSRRAQLRDGILFRRSEVDRVDVEADEVHLENGKTIPYDVLVVATGSRLQPDATDGMTGPGWMENVFTFYTPEGAAGLAEALRGFDAGRVVVNFVDLPIRCPVAPLELAFLADWYFHDCGVRDDVDLTFVTPLDAAFTAARPSSSDRRGSATTSASSPRTHGRCSRSSSRTCSRSVTRRTSRRRRRAP